MKAYLVLDSWNGREKFPVRILNVERDHYRVLILKLVPRTPTDRHHSVNDVVVVRREDVVIEQ